MSVRRRRLLQGLTGGAGVWSLRPAQPATPGVDRPPLPGPQRPLVVPEVVEQRLDNGLTVLSAPRPGYPLVTVALHTRAGRDQDPPGMTGLAALCAALLPKGARRQGRAVDASTLAVQAEALGSGLDVASGWRTASLAMTVTTPKLPAALALMADVLRQPLLQADELDRLRVQTLDALKLTLASPGEVAGLAARRLYWGASVHGGSATPASLQRLTLEAVQRHHASLVRPDRTVLVLAGDIAPQAAHALGQQLLGDWPRPTQPAVPAVAAAAQSLAERALVVMPGSGQSGVVLTTAFAALGDADRRIAEVAAALLGGGYSSRLNQEIRIRRGLTYSAGGSGESHAVGGMFSAYAQTQHATARRVARLMQEELHRVAREAAPEAELAARKANLVGSFARQLETTSGLAAQVASQYFQGRPVGQLARYADEVLAVTPEQVRGYAERHWLAQPPRVVLAGELPPEDGERQVPLSSLDLEQPLLSRG